MKEPTSEAMSELKPLPCPFCGHAPDVEDCDEGDTVACMNHQCWIYGLVIDTETWNRRAHSPAVRELVEAATDSLYAIDNGGKRDRVRKAIATAEREGPPQ